MHVRQWLETSPSDWTWEALLLAMAGSKGGKHSKGKGKSKSNKPDTIKKKPEVFNSKLDSAQISNNNPDGPMESKDKNPHPNINFALTTCRSKYTEKELEEFLYVKFEGLYTKAKDWLLKSGYGMAEVEAAILNAGYIQGQMDLLNNVLTNSIAFIEKKFEPKREAFKDMGELYKTMLEALVDYVLQTRPDIQRSDAMWHLLVRNWGRVPSTTMTSQLQSGDQNTNSILVHGSYGSSSHSKNEDASASAEKVLSESNTDSSLKKVGILKRINLTPSLVSHLRHNVPILTAAVRRKIGAPVIKQQAIPSASGKLTEVSDIVSSDFLTSLTGCSYEACLKEWLESNSDDPKTALIVDLVKYIKDLQEEVKEQKEWAQRKVIDSARRLSKDLLELKLLRMEKVDEEKTRSEKLYAEKSCILKLMETEHSLRKVNVEASFITDAVRRLEIANAQIRADTEAFKLNGSEFDRELKEVLKRERRCMKKLADAGKQRSIFQSQCEEEKQRVLQLEVELLQAEKEAEEAEMKWRQEIEEKEHMFALLAEEIRMVEIQKANSRAQLLKLRQKVEIDSQLAKDDHQRLEDELSRLRTSHQMPDILLEDVNFLYDDAEATSSKSSAPYESSEKTFRHWICMICMQNEVSMVLLPCTHQVLCFPCYEKNCKAVGARCPYCHVGIEDSIRVYGPSS
ncbi:hypothetical protein Pfo_001538 [Paulownia fortunei]|nr:hypothetical protein Pfo_001538 [Paulownia fortunei]